MNLMAIFVPLIVAVAVFLVLAKMILSRPAGDRKATETESGVLEFTPNRRSFWGVYLFLGCLAYLAVANLLSGIRSSEDLTVPALCGGFAALLLAAFPGSIRADKDGIEQLYWLRGRKRIAWNEISQIVPDEKRGEVKIVGRNGTRILFARQLPDQARLLGEIEKRRTAHAPERVASEMYAMSGPAA
jgi:hypothetical protein